MGRGLSIAKREPPAMPERRKKSYLIGRKIKPPMLAGIYGEIKMLNIKELLSHILFPV